MKGEANNSDEGNIEFNQTNLSSGLKPIQLD